MKEFKYLPIIINLVISLILWVLESLLLVLNFIAKITPI